MLSNGIQAGDYMVLESVYSKSAYKIKWERNRIRYCFGKSYICDYRGDEVSLNSLQYENKKKFILEFCDNFRNSNEREKYLLLNEMVKNVEMKNSIDFYRPALNRYFVIINDVLDKIENKERVDYKKIICLLFYYSNIYYYASC